MAVRHSASHEQAPKSKIQAPEKSQTRNPKARKANAALVGIWDLAILWSLEFGAWCFCNGIFGWLRDRPQLQTARHRLAWQFPQRLRYGFNRIDCQSSLVGCLQG